MRVVKAAVPEFVIAANAGTQCFIRWIPAFVGMTRK